MGYVALHHVSFAYADDAPVLQDLNLRLEPGPTAIVGENGAGKTTLLRLVTGDLRPDAGVVQLAPAGAVVAWCPQEVDGASATVRAFAEAADAHAWRLRARFALGDADPARWPTLSPGERRRWQLAGALWTRPDVLLLDEPTNHVDGAARALVIETLRRFDGPSLLVSHDRALIEAVARRTLRLHRGTAHLYEGGWDAARAAWEHAAAERTRERTRQAHAVRAAAHRLADARREQASADRARSNRGVSDPDARTMAAKNRVGWAEAGASRRVEVRRRALERAQEAVTAPVEKRLGHRIHAAFVPCPRPHVAALDVDRIGWPGRDVLRHVHLALDRTARVRIAGANGAGKTTLLHALHRAARDPERVLLLPQELPAAAATRLPATLHALPRAERGRVLEVVAGLGVDPARLLATPCPSPGEARKLCLALALARGAWALFLDEPTNHLDLPSVDRLAELLRGYPGALAVVTHDAAFAADVLTDTWTIAGGVIQRMTACPH